MHRESFRFRPPARELEPELIWTLTRAFGPRSGPPIALARPELVLHWARALKLRERIASRLPRPEAERELPPETVEELWGARAALAARTLLLRELLDRVLAAALEIGVRVVALKGIALLEAGIADWGSRPLLDLDLLVDDDQARRLVDALEADGLGRSGAGEGHHLPPLADRRRGQVELHLSIPGVVVAGSREATAGDLLRLGLTRSSGTADGLELPLPALLAAHALAHALDQHGLSPTAYPVTRLAADLIDLSAPLPAEAEAWLGASVSWRELRAAESLCRALTAGEPEGAGADGLALLRHTVVAFASRRYRARLRRHAAVRALRRRQWSKFRSEVYRWAGGRRPLQ